MVYHLISYWVSFVFPTFYKRIQIKNSHYLKVKAPVIIAMNHPNAFTDPVGLCFIGYPGRFKFLARGDAFKPGFVSWLFDQIGIIPIFRIQDGGKEGLQKNEETYNRVNAYLKKNAKVIVFAEGLCIMERRLRPLKKGVARMIFGAYEFLNDERLIVIPVGVNYSQPDAMRSDLFYNVGEPILMRDFLEGKEKHAARNQNAFLQYLEPKLKELVTHINDKINDEFVEQAEVLCKYEWLKRHHWKENNLEHDFKVRKALTEKINHTTENKNEALDHLRLKTKNYFKQLKKQKLDDALIRPDHQKQIHWIHLLCRCLLLALGFPVFIFGYSGNFLPHRLTFYLTGKLVKHREFFSSFTIAFAMVVFLLYYLILFFCVYAFSNTILPALTVVVVLMLSAWFNLYYQPFAHKTSGILKLLLKPGLYKILFDERKEIMQAINKF